MRPAEIVNKTRLGKKRLISQQEVISHQIDRRFLSAALP